MATRTYNPSVRVGNWIEDVQLEEDIIKDFQEKKENGELLIQKSQSVMTNILKAEQLSEQGDGVLRFGDKVNVQHAATGTVLSAKISTLEAHTSSVLTSPCAVSASLITSPCPRNVFVITAPGAPDECSKRPLCYGQKFVLRTLPGVGGELSLFSDRATFTKCAPKSRLPVVQLQQDSGYSVVWQILCKNPLVRLEMEGKPVSIETPILINHCRTNQNLACLPDYQYKTPYGQEMEVSCKTFLDSHKAETSANIWQLVKGTSSD